MRSYKYSKALGEENDEDDDESSNNSNEYNCIQIVDMNRIDEEADYDDDDERYEQVHILPNLNELTNETKRYTCCFGYCHWNSRTANHRVHDPTNRISNTLIRLLFFTAILSFIVAIYVGSKYDTPSSLPKLHYQNSSHLFWSNLRLHSSSSVEIVSPPENITTACSKSTNNKDLCQEICKKASCCNTQSRKKNCFLQNVYVCSLYSPCYILDSSSSSTSLLPPPPPSNIQSICDVNIIQTSSFSKSQCTAICQEASCCTSQIPSTNCFLQNIYLCLQYAPCHTLTLLPSSSSSSSTTTSQEQQTMQEPTTISLMAQTKELCHLSNLQTSQGRSKCESICRQRRCCFSKNPSENCYLDNQVWCNEIKPCFNLNSIQQHLPPPPIDKLTQVCPDFPKDCIQECRVSECCVKELHNSDYTNSSESCLKDNVDSCESYYLYCHDFYNVDNTVLQTKVPKHNTPAPKKNTLAPKKNTLAPKKNTVAPKKSSAPEIEKTEAPYSQPKPQPSSETATSSENNNNQLTAPEYLKIQCTQEQISSSNEIYQSCNSLCSDAICCIQSNCLIDVNCDSFQPCHEIWNDNGYYVQEESDMIDESKLIQHENNQQQEVLYEIPNPPSYLKEACEESSSTTSSQICQEICQPASHCCTITNDQTNCNSQNPKCQLYSPCLNTWFQLGYFSSFNTEIPNAPSDLNDVCNENQLQKEHCIQLCLPAKHCCTSLGFSNKECNQDLDICQQYLSCWNVWGISINENKAKESHQQTPIQHNIPNPPNDLLDFCEEVSIQDEIGKQDCNALCLPAQKCCTLKNQDKNEQNLNCNEDLLICQHYKPCWILWNEENINNDQDSNKDNDLSTKEENNKDSVSTKDYSNDMPVKEENKNNSATKEANKDLATSKENNKDSATTKKDKFLKDRDVALQSLQEACKPSNLNSEDGRVKCETQCHPGLCCIGMRGDCSKQATTSCQEVFMQPCRRIWMVLGYFNQDLTPFNLLEEENDDNFANEKHVINVLCSDANLETQEGKDACVEACEEWDCCWELGDTGCYKDNEVFCNEHLICPNNL